MVRVSFRLRDRFTNNSRKVSAYPPVVSISVSNLPAKGFSAKDTSRNIRATKQFTVNIISEPWIANANACAIDAPSDVSEWPLSGLTKAPSVSKQVRSGFSNELLTEKRADSCEARSGQGECGLDGMRGI